MKPTDPVIFVVDDDASVRIALERLLKSIGFRAQTFDTARSFLEGVSSCDVSCCLILDVRMPQMSGLELQEEMALKGINMPIIFVTQYGTVPISVQAMKAGAIDFLEKPFEEQELIDAIQTAVEKDRRSKREHAEIMQVQERTALLTPREYEVFTRVVSGMLNKQIADDLSVSEKTIKSHRARVMGKMKAKSLASLVRMAEKTGIFPASD